MRGGSDRGRRSTRRSRSTTPATSAATTGSWKHPAAWLARCRGSGSSSFRAAARGLCCGGGGGHMWMEVKSKKRVNLIRVEEVLETKADIVGTGCPFCLAMMDLGRKVKEAEGTLQVKDVSELVAESLD